MKNLLIGIIAINLTFVISENLFALDLSCDAVQTADSGRKVEIEGTYRDPYVNFKDLKPDKNETFMDDTTKVVITWNDSQLMIERDETRYTWSSLYFINRKDFSMTGILHHAENLKYIKGTCKIWEKPKDNAF